MVARISSILIAAFLVLTLAGSVSAALRVRGQGTITSPGQGSGGTYNLIYDTVQNITWLDFTANADTWPNQMDWAEGLVVQYDGRDIGRWRLTRVDEAPLDLEYPWSYEGGDGTGFGWEGPDGSGNYGYYWGYNMTNSEMGHLYYESMHNLGLYSEDGVYNQPGWNQPDFSPFSNLAPLQYWTATDYSPDTDHSWFFYMRGGQLNHYLKDGEYSDTLYAVAVKTGDVPVPAAVWLLGSGLLGLFGLRRKFKKD